MKNVTSHTAFINASKKKDLVASGKFARYDAYFDAVYKNTTFDGILAACLKWNRKAVQISQKKMENKGAGYVQGAMPIYLDFALGKKDFMALIESYESHLKVSDRRHYESLMRRMGEHKGVEAFDIIVKSMLGEMNAYSDLISNLCHKFPDMNHEFFVDFRDDSLFRPAVMSYLKDRVPGDIKSHFQAYLDGSPETTTEQSPAARTAEILPFKR